jgi:hypothetical protein
VADFELAVVRLGLNCGLGRRSIYIVRQPSSSASCKPVADVSSRSCASFIQLRRATAKKLSPLFSTRPPRFVALICLLSVFVGDPGHILWSLNRIWSTSCHSQAGRLIRAIYIQPSSNRSIAKLGYCIERGPDLSGASFHCLMLSAMTLIAVAAAWLRLA